MRGARFYVTAVIAAALLATGGPATAQQTATPRAVGEPGIAYLLNNLELQATPSGVWADSGLEVTLPEPGTYDLDLDVRGAISGVPPVNAFIVARLLNVTAGTPVEGSERMVVQVVDANPGAARVGDNDTVPISERITVDRAPMRIRLQAQRNLAAGQTMRAVVISDAHGRTSFRFQRIAR